MINTHNIEEQDLIDLDFKMIYVSKEEHGGDQDFYYYVLELFLDDKFSLSLLSNANDDVITSRWKVYLFDNDNYYFDDIEGLTNFILAAKNAKRRIDN